MSVVYLLVYRGNFDVIRVALFRVTTGSFILLHFGHRKRKLVS